MGAHDLVGDLVSRDRTLGMATQTQSGLWIEARFDVSCPQHHSRVGVVDAVALSAGTGLQHIASLPIGRCVAGHPHVVIGPSDRTLIAMTIHTQRRIRCRCLAQEAGRGIPIDLGIAA